MSTESQNEKERNEMIVKRIDFEHGSIPSNILNAAIPMLVAQLLSLLYNIIDRIYIARIPHLYRPYPWVRHSRPRRSGTVLSADRHPQRIRQSLWKRRCSAFFHPAGGK